MDSQCEECLLTLAQSAITALQVNTMPTAAYASLQAFPTTIVQRHRQDTLAGSPPCVRPLFRFHGYLANHRTTNSHITKARQGAAFQTIPGSLRQPTAHHIPHRCNTCSWLQIAHNRGTSDLPPLSVWACLLMCWI